MDWADYAVKGFALLGAVVFTYYAARHGLGWVFTKVASWVTVAKSDFSALEARVSTLEGAPTPATTTTVATPVQAKAVAKPATLGPMATQASAPPAA